MKKDTDNKKIKECEKLKNEYLAGWKRARADFLNYKKEEDKRKKQAVEYAKEGWIFEILLILDNIDIAENKMPRELKKNEWVAGLLQIKNQILDFLKVQGVEEVKSAGESFDPNFHEVVQEIESKDKKSGIVAEEIQKGYIFQGKVIRPARVKVVK